ncbi:carbohydrate kinase [Candidatus Methylomirabilis lanthanidiphila]|uniref:Bifunctional NAD(P)H-hydrate repair enzyme n=1 Tax=Candidatus Methylomirabilis lanthanidiphila TaxID=2211376 RepID=A0A564ZHL1_9BACT|nr:carbohydrate kinase [Candidatus Methylomirabilis lanthanidiphila]
MAVHVVTAGQMRELDRRATEEYGIPSLLLMENAGLQAVLELERAFPRVTQCRVAVVCGKGNNGGDGFVAARHLFNRGVAVEVVLLARQTETKGDAGTNLEIIRKLGVPIREATTGQTLQASRYVVERADVVVDAILGTGTTGPATGLFADAIELLNGCGKPIVALDIPSGLNSDEGVIPGPCIKALFTVTFGLPKRGVILYPAASCAGRVVTADIGLPRQLLSDSLLDVSLVQAEDLAGALPPRDPNAHKGTYGHVLVLAGSPGKTGAAAMCAVSALRIGTGLVTLALPESLNDAMEAKLTEVMTEPLPETGERTVAFAALDRILELMKGKRVVAIGPGLSTYPETAELVRTVVHASEAQFVVDADGINALGPNLEMLRTLSCPPILTPHPGELARLLGIDRDEVVRNRIPIAQKVATSFGVYLVLKGARTLIANPEGHVAINMTGNAGMATGGTGDVLTGLIAGLLAQGVSADLATRAAVYLHGLAGDLAAEAVGQEAMVASDVIAQVPEAIRQLKAHAI